MERPGRAAVVNVRTLRVVYGTYAWAPIFCTTIILHYGKCIITFPFIIIMGRGENEGNASFTKAQFLEQ